MDDEHEGSEGAQAETWPQKLGLTEDQWQRFLTGFHQDEVAARRAAGASKVGIKHDTISTADVSMQCSAGS